MNRYEKSCVVPFHGKLRREMKIMASELNEHRYYLEQKVALRTEALLKRIELLESCNDALCCKLAKFQREIASIQSGRTSKASGLSDREARLYVVNTRIKEAVRKQG